MTRAAGDTIERLVAARGLDGCAGLRIAHSRDTGSLVMSLVVEPTADDQVVQAGEALLFLDAQARQRLHQQVLDVRADDFGAAFYLRHHKDHDDRADRAERNRQTAEALRAYLTAHSSGPTAGEQSDGRPPTSARVRQSGDV